MSGVADLTEFILTASILQPNSSIDQIKDIVSHIPMASTLRKKCELAIAFREGRLTNIMAIGKSMMGLEISNGDENLPVQQYVDSPNLSNVSQRNSLQEKEKRICLSQTERNFVLEKMNAKDGALSKEEKMEIATALGHTYRRVSNHITNVKAIRKRKIRKQEQKEKLDSVSENSSPIDKIKDIVSQIPMASTLPKKCEMEIAFRKGRLTDIMAIGKSMVGLGISNGDQNLPVRQNIASPVLSNVSQRDSLQEKEHRICLSNVYPPILTLGDLLKEKKKYESFKRKFPNRCLIPIDIFQFSERRYILEKMAQKDGNLSKEEKAVIAMALGLTDRRVSRYINDVKGARKRKIQRQEQKENLDSIVENSLDYDASY
ncbi:Protein CBG27205 [Caenorhabditis briggsae]|uniref:Protein CBG27205 n=1 Tax=Caenorhabditis briggsae TaxID=6238 RepID=B6IL35_CAEBR|nr:Protein CBG27205 [Caenorhabditis briggsae]CAS00668.1 Protein CBG27205 [Caenorhabditis briggsae]